MKNRSWDLVVVGGGHAGCEAAMAAAKMGMRVLLLSMTVDNIGAMSCNPAIGGLAKGHLVKEIDALGGMMGMAADETAIQFRVLNRAKGTAVQATRCQSDMVLYKNLVRCRIESQPGLTVLQGEAVSLLWQGNKVEGVVTRLGEEIQSRSVILTTGTFLNGLIHIGDQRISAGRAWEFASNELSEHLKQKGFKVGRLKTGTTPRLDKRTIDFQRLETQPGDSQKVKFSFWESKVPLEQVPCHIAFTNPKAHKVILDNLQRSALYGGMIKGVGPRYCPSIEDKLVKFPQRDRHQIFLEPTSLQSIEYYPNGMSTSMPFEVQLAFMRSIEGLEEVEIVRPGYAIEYDYVLPTQLKGSLEAKDAENLYFAGQINGTSGYEEAAAQGLMAGINASLKNLNKEPLILLRNEGYIGVLIDDLVSKGTNEPYRMFTSRAEYRLLLREDNADMRLSQKGYEIGLLEPEKYRIFEQKKQEAERLRVYLTETRLVPSDALNRQLNELNAETVDVKTGLKEALKKPESGFEKWDQIEGIPELESLKKWDEGVKKLVESEIKYAGYIQRQQSQINNYLKIEAIRIPDDFDYEKVRGLSTEVVQKLGEHRPQTLGQADKISGVTPAAITLLMVALKNRPKNRTEKSDGKDLS